MTDRMAEIRERLEAATPGPWAINKYGGIGANGCGVFPVIINSDGWAHDWTDEESLRLSSDRRFIAHAPADIKTLLAIIDAKDAEIARLRRDCAEAYQVLGALAGDRFDTPSVQRALDNLAAAADGDQRPHDDLLPWPNDDKEPLEARND